MGDRRHIRTRYLQLLNAKKLLLILAHSDLAFFFNRSHLQHIRRIGVQFKIFVHVFAQDSRGKRPEALAEFDLEVHHRLRLGRAWIADNRTSTQGTRPEFHSALKKTHYLARRQLFSHTHRQLVLREL